MSQLNDKIVNLQKKLEFFENTTTAGMKLSDQEIVEIENLIYKSLDNLKLEKARRIYSNEIQTLKSQIF
jgi:hypothetical protein